MMRRVAQAQERGHDLLGEMAADIQRRIDGSQQLIEGLKERERS